MQCVHVDPRVGNLHLFSPKTGQVSMNLKFDSMHVCIVLLALVHVGCFNWQASKKRS